MHHLAAGGFHLRVVAADMRSSSPTVQQECRLIQSCLECRPARPLVRGGPGSTSGILPSRTPDAATVESQDWRVSPLLWRCDLWASQSFSCIQPHSFFQYYTEAPSRLRRSRDLGDFTLESVVTMVNPCYHGTVTRGYHPKPLALPTTPAAGDLSQHRLEADGQIL